MILLRTVPDMHATSGRLRREGKNIALVPTMGALHEGHLALIRKARTLADEVIVSIFVNPTQFGQGEDFDRYPRTLSQDVDMSARAGASIVFAPELTTMYPEGYHTYVQVEVVTEVLEGKIRPGHFQGVATIVTKLLHCTTPQFVVFGQKDAQQALVIRRLMRDLDMDIEFVLHPTVRETDGLALSSRNVYLTSAQRSAAPVLYRSLQRAERMVSEGMRNAATLRHSMEVMIRTESGAAIDYISVADAESLEELDSIESGQTVLVSLAARFGATRLIDNILLAIP